MLPTNSAAAPPPPATRSRRFFSPVILAAKGLTLALIVFLTAIAIVAWIPEVNDYVLVTRVKHDRLAQAVPHKIVFVGGSNLAYGLDSSVIERECGTHVVNMGMNGFIGVRFMLEEVRKDVKAPDVVVISPEYDSFFIPPEGQGTDLLAMVKARPESFQYLSWSQMTSVAKAIPQAAQEKLIRLTRESAQSLRHLVTGKPTAPDEYMQLLLSVEQYAGFNHYGDLTSHLNVLWPYGVAEGIDMDDNPINTAVVSTIAGFRKEMAKRGVRVIFAPSPIAEDFYQREREGVAKLASLWKSAFADGVLSDPERYVFPPSQHFDTAFHLNGEGRVIRSQRMAEDLRRASACPAQGHAVAANN